MIDDSEFRRGRGRPSRDLEGERRFVSGGSAKMSNGSFSDRSRERDRRWGLSGRGGAGLRSLGFEESSERFSWKTNDINHRFSSSN